MFLYTVIFFVCVYNHTVVDRKTELLFAFYYYIHAKTYNGKSVLAGDHEKVLSAIINNV